MPWTVKTNKKALAEYIFHKVIEDQGINLDYWSFEFSNYLRSKRCYQITGRRIDKEGSLSYTISVPPAWFNNDYVIAVAASQMYAMIAPAETARLLES